MFHKICIMVPSFMLTGFLIDAAMIPWWLLWFRYLSIFYWGFRAYMTWSWRDVALEKCTAEEFLKYPDDCWAEHEVLAGCPPSPARCFDF